MRVPCGWMASQPGSWRTEDKRNIVPPISLFALRINLNPLNYNSIYAKKVFRPTFGQGGQAPLAVILPAGRSRAPFCRVTGIFSASLGALGGSAKSIGTSAGSAVGALASPLISALRRQTLSIKVTLANPREIDLQAQQAQNVVAGGEVARGFGDEQGFCLRLSHLHQCRRTIFRCRK